jgi:hypothetical protein
MTPCTILSPVTADAAFADDRVQQLEYHSLAELRQLLTELDSPAGATTHVVLKISEECSGGLATLCERRLPGARLCIVSPTGRLMRYRSLAELKSASRNWQWMSTSFRQDTAAAVNYLLQHAAVDESVVVLQPTWSWGPR